MLVAYCWAITLMTSPVNKTGAETAVLQPQPPKKPPSQQPPLQPQNTVQHNNTHQKAAGPTTFSTAGGAVAWG